MLVQDVPIVKGIVRLLLRLNKLFRLRLHQWAKQMVPKGVLARRVSVEKNIVNASMLDWHVERIVNVRTVWMVSATDIKNRQEMGRQMRLSPPLNCSPLSLVFDLFYFISINFTIFLLKCNNIRINLNIRTWLCSRHICHQRDYSLNCRSNKYHLSSLSSFWICKCRFIKCSFTCTLYRGLKSNLSSLR